MPQILRPGLYNAVFPTAKTMFETQPKLLDPYKVTRNVGVPLYRFVGYRNFQGQQEKAGRTIWTELAKDTNNRWTGIGTAQSGSQGLYLSGEFLDTKTPFPELEHYQDSSLPPEQEVAYFKYEVGKEPVWTKVKAGELRTMFLFTLTQNLEGINFSLTIKGEEHPLLKEIFEKAKKDNPNVFELEDNLTNLYKSSEDASFTRAIGNALFTTRYEFFQATSVRDLKSDNFIFKGTYGRSIDLLKPQGRASFFIDSLTKKSTGVYTIDDMLYNQQFEETGLGVIAPKEDLAKDFSPFEVTINEISKKDIAWDLAAKNIDAAINSRVSDALNKIARPFDQDVNTLSSNLSTQELKTSLRQKLSDFVLASSATSQDYPTLYNKIGKEGIQAIINAKIVEERYQKLAGSYLEAAIKSTLLEKKNHYLNENQSKIQRDLTSATSKIGQTSNEIKSKQDFLQTIEEKLKSKPENSDLQKQKSDLDREINTLVEAQKKAEAEKDQLEKEQEQNEREAQETSKEKEKNTRGREALYKDVFGGE